MRSKFKSFYQPNVKDKKIDEILTSDKVLFILDTNILLNLYRYKEETRKDFFNILEKIKKRIFIPYHVALEYQKNRIGVISEQNKELRKFVDHIKLLEITNESILNVTKGDINQVYGRIIKKYPDLKELISTITRAYKESCTKPLTDLQEQLEKKIKENIKINSQDTIRDNLDKLGLLIGEPFTQTQLNEIYKIGAERFQNKISPGFGDDKIKSELVFSYYNRVYQQKFGDLIIWEQIKGFLKDKKEYKYIIFITDDQEKNDWVEKIEDDGLKFVGPKIELISELFELNTSIEYFLIFDSINVVKLGGKAFDIRLNDDSVKDIEDNSTYLNKLNQKLEHYFIKGWDENKIDYNKKTSVNSLKEMLNEKKTFDSDSLMAMIFEKEKIIKEKRLVKAMAKLMLKQDPLNENTLSQYVNATLKIEQLETDIEEIKKELNLLSWQ